MKTVLSEAPRLQLEDYILTDGLNQEMLDTMLDYLLTLRVSEGSETHYVQKLKNP